MTSPKTSPQLAQNLVDSQARMKGLLDDTRKFNNDCEEVFEVFRRAVVHCKNNKEFGPQTLDSMDEKQIAVNFMCKFCKARPAFRGRCEEVLKHLMLSDEWKRKFKEDPEAKELPASIIEQLTDGAQEAGASIAVVVQRCTRAQVLVDERENSWTQVGRGLLICIDFKADASKVTIRDAARSLLNAPLSSGADRRVTGSIVSLCKSGEEQNVLVILQPSLFSTLKAGETEIESKGNVEASDQQSMFESFISQLRELAKEATEEPPELERSVSQTSNRSIAVARLPKIVASDSGSSQSWEVFSDGLMHSFTF